MATTSEPTKTVSETTAARRALKAAGYEVVRCKFGRGTARSWIEVTIVGAFTENGFRRNHQSQAYAIVKHAAGRDHLHDDLMTDLFLEQINLDYVPRLPTADEYAAMSRADLEAREEELRDQLTRWEQYHVFDGPRYNHVKTDLEATVQALKSFPPVVGYCSICFERQHEDDEYELSPDGKIVCAACKREAEAPQEPESEAEVEARRRRQNLVSDVSVLRTFTEQTLKEAGEVYGSSSVLVEDLQRILGALTLASEAAKAGV
jgi:hypothetical protein